MRRYRALVEYDGTAYFGFQRQRKEQPTIQGELEKALSHLANQFVAIAGSGRTDSGVHALGQVICFDLDWHHGAEVLLRAINANLPADIAVLQLEVAAPSFHPRFDARRRLYHYHIYNGSVRRPLRRWRSWHVDQRLNVDKMSEAAHQLVGTHDFGTFGRPPQGGHSVRELFRVEWQHQGDDRLIFEIEANAFLYRMVRSIVGTLKLVGEGLWSMVDFEAAFAACDRAQCGMVAPPHGLYLVSVRYDD